MTPFLRHLKAFKMTHAMNRPSIFLSTILMTLSAAFAFLKSMHLVPAKAPITPEQQAKIQALLPQTKIDFK